MVVVSTIATIIAIVGALNWVCFGLFGFNVIAALFGAGAVASIIYVLIGLAGIWLIFYLVRKAVLSAQNNRPYSHQ